MAFDAERLVDDCKRALGEADTHKAVRALLARALSAPSDVLVGLGEPREAGVHKIHHAEDLTILNVVWAPLMTLMPHNHNMWAVIGIYTGREDNIFWRRVDNRVEAAGAKSLCERDVEPLGPDIVHSVTNPIERLTGAIHIYGGDFFGQARSEWDAESLVERPYDIERNMRRFQEANARFAAG